MTTSAADSTGPLPVAGATVASAFRRPLALAEAVRLMDGGRSIALAGATDLYATGGAVPRRELVDLCGIAELRGVEIERQPDGSRMLRIGAATTWSSLRDGRFAAGLQALPLAAGEVGGPQVQNRATIGGNLCNASPAADGIVALLALDAEVEIATSRGRRRLALDDFVRGPRQTALEPGELLVAVRVPVPPGRAGSVFAKLGQRRYLVIAVAMVAAAVRLGADGRVDRCAIAIGSCGPRAVRVPALEQGLAGQRPEVLAALPRHALETALADVLSPIDDVRATASYRLRVAAELVSRALRDAVAMA